MGMVFIGLGRYRYFKIVHAVAHRKYYHNWMTKVGVALPWTFGVCFLLIPAIPTTRIIDGTCRRNVGWPSRAMASVSALFIFLFLPRHAIHSAVLVNMKFIVTVPEADSARVVVV